MDKHQLRNLILNQPSDPLSDQIADKLIEHEENTVEFKIKNYQNEDLQLVENHFEQLMNDSEIKEVLG